MPVASSAKASTPTTSTQTCGVRPTTVSSPSAAPAMLPVSKAAVPKPIAVSTSATATTLNTGLSKVVRSASPRPSRLMMPRRALISCSTMVAKIENASAQSSA